jgi:hypothetical protein
MSERRFEIVDPDGFVHVLVHDGAWYGFENIAHVYPPEQQNAMTAHILASLLHGNEILLPTGYRVLPPQ